MTKIHGYRLPRCEGYFFTDLKDERYKYASLITLRENAIWYAEHHGLESIYVERYWTENPFGEKEFIHDYCGLVRRDGKRWYWCTDKECREIDINGRYVKKDAKGHPFGL